MEKCDKYQPDFIKIIGRYQVDPQAFSILYMVVFSVVKDTFYLPSISLLPLESQKYSMQVNRSPFSLRIFLLTRTPEFDVTVTIVTYAL